MTDQTYPGPLGPGELIVFFVLEIKTIEEGYAYVYMAYDVERDFLINIGMEDNGESDTIVKNIYLLLEHQEFLANHVRPFRLVIAGPTSIENRVIEILKPDEGILIIDPRYHEKLIEKPINAFLKSLGANE